MIKQQIVLYTEKGCSDCNGKGLQKVRVERNFIMEEEYQILCHCVEIREVLPPNQD